MRKFSRMRILLALFVAMLLGFATAQAQTGVYDIEICGVQVTPHNKDKIAAAIGSENGKVTGKVSYNFDTRTLRLENAKIQAVAGKRAITIASYEGEQPPDAPFVTIELVGNNTVISENAFCLAFLCVNVAIKGRGASDVLNASVLTFDHYSAITVAGATLLIKNCKVNATSAGVGFSGEGHTISLIFENATVSATGTNHGSISSFTDLKFTGCGIVSPAGVKFNPDKKAVCYKNGDLV